jgi:hypothetical protein
VEGIITIPAGFIDPEMGQKECHRTLVEDVVTPIIHRHHLKFFWEDLRGYIRGILLYC